MKGLDSLVIGCIHRMLARETGRHFKSSLQGWYWYRALVETLTPSEMVEIIFSGHDTADCNHRFLYGENDQWRFCVMCGMR